MFQDSKKGPKSPFLIWQKVFCKAKKAAEKRAVVRQITFDGFAAKWSKIEFDVV